MKNIDIYKQYFSAQCSFAGMERRAAADEIAATYNATIHWDKPLTEAQYG